MSNFLFPKNCFLASHFSPAVNKIFTSLLYSLLPINLFILWPFQLSILMMLCVSQPITVPLTKSGSYICHLTCSSCSMSQIFALCLFFLHTLEIRVVKQKFYDKVEESKYQYPHQLKLLCNVLLLPGLSKQATAMQ